MFSIAWKTVRMETSGRRVVTGPRASAWNFTPKLHSGDKAAVTGTGDPTAGVPCPVPGNWTVDCSVDQTLSAN